jgi:Ni/Co efflux regulator RcnB
MRKLIILAAMAATVAPTAAVAQEYAQARHERAQVRQDKRTVRANRQVVRSDRRATRANQRVARTAHRARSAYVAPVRNWRYRPVTVGYRLQPSFYGSRYYVTNYSAYHLQAPRYRYLRWIRYGDDLLLVNIRTGRVLQVIHYAGW